MNILDRIADVISLGAVSRAREAERKATHRAAQMVRRLERKEAALLDISRMETPKCAHIGRRMARRAREGL